MKTVLMYDVEVYDDKHIFIANGIACSNSHKMPILDAESFEYIDFSKNSRDMEFYKFLEYLIKLLCALYTISPEEIGFPLEGAGHGGMGKGDGKEEKDYSKDKGLHPLLTHVETPGSTSTSLNPRLTASGASVLWVLSKSRLRRRANGYRRKSRPLLPQMRSARCRARSRSRTE